MTAADVESERWNGAWRRQHKAELAREEGERRAMAAESQAQRDAAVLRVLAEETDMREVEQRAREREQMRVEDAAAARREAQDAAEERFKAVVYTDFRPYFPDNEARLLLSPEPAAAPREGMWRREARAATEEVLSLSPVPRLVDCADSERLQRLLGLRRGTRKRIHVGGPPAATADVAGDASVTERATPSSAFYDRGGFAPPPPPDSQRGASAGPARRHGELSGLGAVPSLGPTRRRGVRDEAASTLARASHRGPALTRTRSWLAASAEDIRGPLSASERQEALGSGEQRVEYAEAGSVKTPARHRPGGKARLPTPPGSRSPGGAGGHLVGSSTSPPLCLDTRGGEPAERGEGQWAVTGPPFALETRGQRRSHAPPSSSTAGRQRPATATANSQQAVSAPDARLQLTTGVPFAHSATQGHVVGGQAAPLFERPARRRRGRAVP